MDKEVTVRGHSKTSWGKGFSVKSYKRRVGKKGIIRWKTSKRTEQPIKDVGTPPPLPPQKGSSEWAEKWDTEARSMERTRQNKLYKKSATEETIQKAEQKYDDMFSRAEAKVAEFVERYTNKKYKKML